MNYKKMLKDSVSVKLKVVKPSGPQVLNENEVSITTKAKIRRITKKINELNERIESTKDKKEKYTLEMTLRKEKAKLKTLTK